MSTHNICFHGEIRRFLSGYPSNLELPVAFFSQDKAHIPLYVLNLE